MSFSLNCRPMQLITIVFLATCTRDPLPPSVVLAAPVEPPHSPPTPAPFTPPPPVAPTPAPEPKPNPATPRDAAACLRNLQVDGRRLAVSWPSKIGQQVALSARVERALDIGQYVMRADGERFLVTAIGGPEAWEGDQLHLFTVIGRGLAHVHGGPQHLPQLMLLGDGACGEQDPAE